MGFPTDAAGVSGIARDMAKFTRIFIRTRYRSSVGDSNAAAKQPLVIQLAPSQTANAIEVYDSSQNLLWAVDPSGQIVQGGITNITRKVAQVSLTAAQIISLNTSPVTLVAAPGAGKALFVRQCVFQMKYGTVQFTGGGAVNPVYHGATTNLLIGSVAAATIQAAANCLVACGGPAGPTSVTANAAVDLYAATQNFAAGDSTGIVTLEYDLITLG